MTGVNVWVEAVFIQMERGITRHFEESIGFKLSPPDGKALLNAEEKETILAAVEKTEKARIIASLSCLTIPGQQTQTEHVEEFTYPTEYKAEGDTIVPGNWEQRDIGAILNVTPTAQEREEGTLIYLILMPEVTTLCGWKTYDGSEFGQPIFMTSNITTTVAVPDGMTFALKQSPVTSPFVSQAVDPEGATSPENQVTLLLLVSAKLVPYE
jgi:Flp pilus assembly secretin CpaC